MPELTHDQASIIQAKINRANQWVQLLEASQVDLATWNAGGMPGSIDPIALAEAYPQFTVNDISNAEQFEKDLLAAVGGAVDQNNNPILDWLNGHCAFIRKFLP